MKIGVYGDSFAAPRQNLPGETDISWWEWLQEQGHEVTTWGKNASSLWYSVRGFLATHTEYDSIVFLVTSPHRFILPSRPDILFPEDFRYIAGLYNTEFNSQLAKQRRLNPEVSRILNCAKDYIVDIQDTEFDVYAHNLMVAEIRRIRPDAVILPCFSNSLPDLSGSIPLIYINEVENHSLGEDWNSDWEKLIRSGVDLRRCHMTQANNIMIGKKVLNCLLTGERFCVTSDDIIQPTESIRKYFVKIS